MYFCEFEKFSSLYPCKMVNDLELCLSSGSSLDFNMMLMGDDAISVLEILSKISWSGLIGV